ncbi:MAG: sel1 repeat family protein [Verrucomicrobiales bacterium]|nr:sel1 repeat family protein [Verrucomicrobiales bacterium]
MMYKEGDTVSVNFPEAFKWFLKAAEQGNATAQQEVAAAYAAGRGVLQSERLAAEWSLKAANGGDEDAKFATAENYRIGRGVKQDIRSAIVWYGKMTNTVRSDLMEGLCYSIALGELRRGAEALRRAAKNNSAAAKTLLGTMHEFGEGVEKDQGVSIRLFQEAAYQGEPIAQHNLAICTLKGDRLERNIAQGFMWMYLAASYIPEAKGALTLYERSDWAQFLPEGARRAKQFRPKEDPTKDSFDWAALKNTPNWLRIQDANPESVLGHKAR